MRVPMYFNWCPTCGAEPRRPCRTTTSGRVTDTHQLRIRTQKSVHAATSCEGESCVLHNPSDHHMADWPLLRRYDRSPPLIERQCEHGVGHPDPDSAAWGELAVRENPMVWQDEISDGKFVWVHGCDGCCRSDDTPRRSHTG